MIRKTLLYLFVLPLVARAQIAPGPARTSGLQRSDAFLQGFYWNSTPGGIWWDSLAHLAPKLAAAGFSAVWFPPPTKGAAGSLSMGYDIYDHFDFGDYNQKGSISTRFGTRSGLEAAVAAYHANGMEVFADAVMGHMNGGDEKVPYECKPYPSYPDSGFLKFDYTTGSGRFKKDASFFYPNLQTCDVNAPYHGPSDPIFKFGEILAHAQEKVKDSLIVWGKYIRESLGFDGFRIDEAKSIDPIFVGPWTAQADSGGYAVAEYYGSTSEIQTWLHYCNDVFGGHAAMFDFPLRFSLQAMCNATDGSYDMNNLDFAGLVNAGTSGYNVATFVENHDLDRTGWDGSVDNGHNPIIYNKDMAYAYTIFSEGRPCVWFRDYFIYGLEGRIDTLLWIRSKFLYGGTTKRGGLSPFYVGSLASQADQSTDIYVARRDGGNGHPAAYLVLNDNPYEWRGVWVNTSYPNQVFRDFTGKAMDKTAAGDGRVDLWAPPRGYAVYVPDTTVRINHPPYIAAIPPLHAYTNTLFRYQAAIGDPNNDTLVCSMSGAPAWLSISPSGLLSGTPGINDVSPSTVSVTVTDPSGDTASATFQLGVVTHPLMDGDYEGTGIWGEPAAEADTSAGWDSSRVRDLEISVDSSYWYFGAHIRARQWMTWAFLINTKAGGGSTDSWGRSIVYNHANLPDYVVRGTFGGYAEFHTWNGGSWSGVGTPLAAGEYAARLSSDSLAESWIEARIPRTSIGNPGLVQAQVFLTGNNNNEATFDACPNDQNTTVWSGVTTHLHYYADRGSKTLTQWNLQFPQSAMIAAGGSFTAYARTFGFGVTDSAGPGAGVEAWIGYDSANTNPAGWGSWLAAAYNVDNNFFDEYKASFGAALAPGTYRYASRFRYDGGAFLYGGYSAAGGGLWDSVHNVSGTLIVIGIPPAPQLLAPADGALHEPSAVTLSWNAIPYAQRYRVQVARDSLFSLLVDDDSLTSAPPRLLAGLANDSTYYWRVRAKNIAGTGAWSAARSFTVSQTTRSYGVSPSWNMLSLPMNVFEPRKSFLFPSASSQAFAYDPGHGYAIRDTLVAGTGYWLKFASPESVTVTGYPLTAETLAVQTGWNMIGVLSTPVSGASITASPAGLISSRWFSYAGGYKIADTLMPSRAYWVKCVTPGSLILGGSGVAKPAAATADAFVTIKDAEGNEARLLLSTAPAPEGDEMPPVPPPGAFDIRFGSGRASESVGERESRSLALRAAGVHYPVAISFDAGSTGLSASMAAGRRSVTLGTAAVVADTLGDAITVAGRLARPLAFSLAQNFPNPFNPSTTIRYSLPSDARVRLTVSDILGRTVAVAVDGSEEAGEHSVEWRNEGLASGVYFYRLEAEAGGRHYAETRKMLILR